MAGGTWLEPTVPAPPAATTRLPYTFAKAEGAMITGVEGGRVKVVHRPGVSLRALSEVRRFARAPLALAEVSAERFDAMLEPVYSTQAPMEMLEGIGEELDLGELVQQLEEPGDLLENVADAPIIRLINALLTEAVKENASDLHIEPYQNRLVIRLRVDGVLREVLEPRRELAPLLVSRVKVMAQLDIAEKRLPQDGRISLKVAGRAIDVRVSTIPSGHGERAVLRLLDKQAGRIALEQLGMPEGMRTAVDGLIERPHGMLLVTGPTGSGKTTTLYSMLSRINHQSRNIMTVEEPIEYYLDGVGQTQVNTKVDMSFARGLRAILRQDPDIVMVGEIRDLETARIAVQASLTGHLVFSTLHTNTAVGAITRLVDLGVEPFLLSSSLLATLAQRLVRLLCEHCKRAYPASDPELEALGVTSGPRQTLYQAVGCGRCRDLGFRGRVGVFEVVTIDERLRRMISERSPEAELERHARDQGPGIRTQAAQLVLSGRTTLAELERVSRAQ